MILNRSISSFLSILCVMAVLSVISSPNYASSSVKESVADGNAELVKDKQAPALGTVNINTSEASQIAAVLKGVGLKKAQAIVDWRNTNGYFRAIEQLLEVKGIGEKILSDNKGRISI